MAGYRFHASGARRHTFHYRCAYSEPDPLKNVKTVACGLLHFCTGSACSESFWCGRTYIACCGSPTTHIPLHEHLFRARLIDNCKTNGPQVFTFLYSLHALKHSGVAGYRFHASGARLHTIHYRCTYSEPDPLNNVKTVARRCFSQFFTDSSCPESF